MFLTFWPSNVPMVSHLNLQIHKPKVDSYLMPYVCCKCNMTFKTEFDLDHMYQMYILCLMNCLNMSLKSAPSSYIVIPMLTFNLHAPMNV